MRDEESDAIRTLVPLYQAFSGRSDAVVYTLIRTTVHCFELLNKHIA
jgi:hypothetical protein